MQWICRLIGKDPKKDQNTIKASIRQNNQPLLTALHREIEAVDTDRRRSGIPVQIEGEIEQLRQRRPPAGTNPART